MVVPREIKFNAYTKCLGANEVYYGRCANCEWNPVLFLRSICHCGCEREGSDIKRDGWVSCFIICHCGKKKIKVAFKTWQLDFFHHPRYTHVRKTIKTLSYVSRIKTLPLALCHQNSQGLVLGSLLFTDTLCADDIGLFTSPKFMQSI